MGVRAAEVFEPLAEGTPTFADVSRHRPLERVWAAEVDQDILRYRNATRPELYKF